MNPHISLPRPHGGPSTFGGTPSSRSRSSGIKMPRFFKQLPRFSQLDLELATSEMFSLLTSPKKVFRSIYYHKQTKNTYHTGDPSFTLLLSFFVALTSLAWSLAYTYSVSATLTHLLSFVFLHCIGSSLLLATAFYFLAGRLLKPGIPGLPGRRRQQGLFGGAEAGSGRSSGGGSEQVEFGYCFDVSIRAFFPLFLLLYVLQFLLWPLLRHNSFIALLLGNTLYLGALGYWTLIQFLGFNALPDLHHTHLLLAPVGVFAVLWLGLTVGGVHVAKIIVPALLWPL